MKHARILTLLCLVSLTLHSWSQRKDDKEIESYLNFLYQYMPLPDSTDYSRDFWRMNVELALQARREMPWQVPEREWRHFVLPLRVNNEGLDEARRVFYPELKERVRGLSMQEAILEVNRWCHERVTYQPSDSRTRSPLALLRSGTGRCGEESTFAVTALRAVGIPARQVYTPRWAHTDDNHAWVEAWADGQWHFLGACEPEPVLNLGWFNAPASRGMLMHTKVFGAYDGPERILAQNACYTEIDVTQHYAPTSSFHVKTLDTEGNLCPARIDLCLYNYAELYPLTHRQSQGLTEFAAGRGTLFLWASNGGRYGFAACQVGQQDTVTITLSSPLGQQDWDIIPPPERNTIPPLTPEQIAHNKRQLARGDSIRNARPHGNQAVMDAFLKDPGDPNRAKRLLRLISEKDRGDVTLEVLTDHYLYSRSVEDDVLNPRVYNEGLTPYKELLGRELPQVSLSEWADWVRDSIRVDNSRNPQHLCMSPFSVWRHRTTDSHSRDLFYVAGARALGHAARYDEVNRRPSPPLPCTGQAQSQPKATGLLRLKPASASDENTSYYTHFTLSRIEDGRPRLLEYPWENTTWRETFAQDVELEQGTYLLTCGTRLANGSVLARTHLFELGDSLTVPLALRHDEEQLQVIGSLNSEGIFTSPQGTRQSILSATGRGYYALGLTLLHHEPSNHALHDIALKQKELEATGRPILLLNAEDNAPLVDEIVASLHLESRSLPLFVIADTFNRIVWVKQGYTIGLGEQLLKAFGKLE